MKESMNYNREKRLFQGRKSGCYLLLVISLIIMTGINLRLCAEVKPVSLSCEMLANPVGIDVVSPRLSWKLQGGGRDIYQTAYRIIVASTQKKLSGDKADLWDSGKVFSDQSVFVVYNGKKLESRMNCYWKVLVWTSAGKEAWSEPARWSMGLLYYKDWSGRWIGFDRAFPWDNDVFHSRLSARYFRKEFEVSRNVIQARVYIVGLGLYELYINGEKIGDQVLAPSPTDYAKNVKYNAFDVTGELKSGENAIGVILGNGRYYTMRQHYKPYKIRNFGFPKVLLQLEIKYDDGTSTIIRSDGSWKGTADGPIRSNNEYDGEIYDARKEMQGWSKAGFYDTAWLNAEYVQAPDGQIEAQMNPNMKVVKRIRPVSVGKVGPGKYILDMGQNMGGWLKMTVNGGKRGDQVTLRFAEILTSKGELFVDNLRDAQATDIYIMKGDGVETWEPRFIYHGFRYVEITGYPGIPTPDDFSGQVVSDEMAVTGEFTTSNPLINQIYKNASWGILSNYKGMPVDCPQRNERQPWLGDRAAGSLGESFIFDNEKLYAKWMDDIAYNQKEDGCICDVVPAFWNYYSDNMTWPGTYLMICDMLYQQYGDLSPIQKHYQSMKKWLQYMKDRYMDEDFIVTKDSYGDWCPPPETIEEGRGKSADQKHPDPLIATAYYYYFMGLMQKFAKLTGNDHDIEEYFNLAENIKNAFNKEFWHADAGGYGENTLTENLLALHFGLVPQSRHQKVFDHVVTIIMNDNKGHLSTGMVGTQWIMRTLTENGRTDIAYLLASGKTYPSWGYMVENGATTIWELWNGNTAAPKMNSYNHVMMLGDLVTWFYEDLAGIRSSEENPGFKQIIMNPDPVDSLDFVKASFQSVYGLIRSEWNKKGKNFNWNITVPVNCSAIVYIPARSKSDVTENGISVCNQKDIEFMKMENGRMVYKIGSGDYHFSSSIE